MNTKIVKKFKWFWAWQDEKEEDWLREMSKNGYHLKRPGFFGSFEFDLGEPTDYIYRLDFNASSNKDLDNYLQLFEDAGWDYLGNLGGWQYFRIKAISGGRPEIYSDNELKIQKYQRLIASLTIFFPVYFIDMVFLSKYDFVLRILYCSYLLLLSFFLQLEFFFWSEGSVN